jgi:hypothetical protein
MADALLKISKKNPLYDTNPPLYKEAASTTKLFPTVLSPFMPLPNAQIVKHSNVPKAQPIQQPLEKVVVVNPFVQKQRVHQIKHFSSISVERACYSQPMDIVQFTQSTTMKDD